MKYEFHCAPGADYTQIRIQYDGIDSLCVNDEGDLEIAISFGTLRDGAPIVWQEDAGSTSRAREEAELDAARAAPLADTRGSSNPPSPPASISSTAIPTASPSTARSIRRARSSSILRLSGTPMRSSSTHQVSSCG